ncbi:MAG: hypothetical protein R3C68_19835 [Myxococcota bacterium]
MPKQDDSDEFKLQGPFRRNMLLLAGVVMVTIAGPSISRVLEEYRGIVLDLRDDTMLLGFEGIAPKWVSAIEAQRGDLVEKSLGSWQPTVVEKRPGDHSLLKMHERYSRTYVGTVIRVNAPVSPKGPSSAVVQLDNDGGIIRETIWAEHLATIAVGSRLEKHAGAWDPVIVDGGVASQPVQFDGPSAVQGDR